MHLNDRTTASGEKKRGGGERWCMQNKRVLCAEDETPWETIKATSEVAGGGVKCVCVRDVGGRASQDPAGVDMLKVAFAFSI